MRTFMIGSKANNKIWVKNNVHFEDVSIYVYDNDLPILNINNSPENNV